jgi:hypothetical protein
MRLTLRSISTPSRRMPVPASRMTRCSGSGPLTATQAVSPPKAAVSGPDVAIDPRVPQKVTFIPRRLPRTWLLPR